MDREEIIKAIIPLLREIDTYDDIGDSYYRSYAEKIINLCAEYYGNVNGKLARLEKKIHEKIEKFEKIDFTKLNKLDWQINTMARGWTVQELKSLLENEK